MTGPFEAGERALLLDQRGRRYLVTLRIGETWHSHGGALPHDLLIGSPEGSEVRSASGMTFRAFRPRMADFVLKMPRGAQVVYPKDVGPILVEADVYPGSRVLEAGTGSGSMTPPPALTRPQVATTGPTCAVRRTAFRYCAAGEASSTSAS